MNASHPSELLYLIGFTAIVFVAFWSIGPAVESGRLQRKHALPAYLLLAALLTGAFGFVRVIDRHWLGAAFFGCGVIYFLFAAWRRWQRG